MEEERLEAEDLNLVQLSDLSRYIERRRRDVGVAAPARHVSEAQEWPLPSRQWGREQAGGMVVLGTRLSHRRRRDTIEEREKSLIDVGLGMVEEEVRRQMEHEKRIAAIVAEHWRGLVMRSRASRHRSEALRRLAWRAWQDKQVAARRKLRSAVIWDHRRLFLLRSACFREWGARGTRAAKLRRIHVEVLRARARCLYAACVQAWVEYAAMAVLRREAEEKADGAAKRSALKKALEGWRLSVEVLSQALTPSNCMGGRA